MKPNIDLTMNRDFRKKEEVWTSISSLPWNKSPRLKSIIADLKVIYKSYPWSKYKIKITDNMKIKGFYTGNSTEIEDQRAYEKKHEEIYSERDCQRCGEDCKSRPWLMSYGLCFECSRNLVMTHHQRSVFLESL